MDIMTSNSIPTGSTPLSTVLSRGEDNSGGVSRNNQLWKDQKYQFQKQLNTENLSEGESVDSESMSGNTTPSCLKWASSLKVLLNDTDGLNLFQEYLEQEDPERYNMLKFWLACKGLSKQPSKKAHQLVKVIYTQLFLKAQLGIGEDLRRHVTRQIKEATSGNNLLPVTIFNDACKQVERVINDVMYPNFLRSDLYLSHVQKTQNIHCFSSGGYLSESGKSPNSVLDDEYEDMPPAYAIANQPLPSVDENMELSLPLTKGSLSATERNRTYGRSSHNDCPGKYLQYGGITKPINPYHTRSRLSHLSFNPVSRQDSELQSLSSDARTNSMSDVSYDESMDSCFHKKMHHRQIIKQMKANASINQDSNLNEVTIPRTMRMQDNMQMKPANPQQFAAELIQRLELVKQEEEKGERIGKKLIEMEGEKFVNTETSISLDPRVLSDAIREKLLVDDDNEQDILDQHVSRVWNDWTPRRSPSLGTPVRPKSPPMKSYPHQLSNKISSHSGGFLPRVPHQYIGTGLSKRKNKDVYSSDSGNGTDLAEGSEHNRHTLAKGKSSSDYTYQSEQLQSPNSLPGHLQNLNFVDRTWSSSRNTLTDSGVSVVSGTYQYVPSSSQSIQHKEKLQETYHNERAALPCSLDRDISLSKHKYRSCAPGSSAYSSFRSKSGPPVRPTNLNTINANANRNNATNRTQVFMSEQPSPTMQFVDQQSDKNRRRYLEDEIARKLNKQRYGKECTNVMKTQDTARTISQLKIIRPCNDDTSFTTVVYNFSDEQVPYRSKVPGNPITLRQFKDYMPKKGHYRYFFMTACEELDMRPIQEEITDDNQFLPLWKGKVTAQIKLVD